MPVTIDTSIDFTNPDLKDFLIDEDREQYALFDHTVDAGQIIASPPEDYLHDPSLDVRESEVPDTKTYDFLVEEVYRVKQSNGIIGRVPATVHSKAKLEIYCDFLLFLKSTLSDVGKAHARELLRNYNINDHGRNIYNYLEAEMDPARLTDDDFDVVPGVRIKKIWQDKEDEWRASQRNPSRSPDPWQRLTGYVIDFNDAQRRRVLAQYDNDIETDMNTRVDVIGGVNDNGDEIDRPVLGTIITENNVTLTDPPEAESRKIVEADSSTNSAAELELPAGFTDSEAISFINTLMEDSTRDACPPRDMQKKTIRIMTVLQYPEFKVVWKRATIKIGCARISFKYPTIQTRTCKRVLYAHYSIPKRLGVTLFKIAETCAIRSALASAVIGIVLANPGAAATSFSSLFKACVKRELERCINPGMYMMKERTGWS